MNIIVLGAYGYTGSLICQQLKNENISFTIGGRKKESLEKLARDHQLKCQIEIIELTDENCISQIVSDYDLFINCIGPFTETANLLLEQVANLGKFYIDITGEIGFVENSRKTFHEIAIKNRSTILHSCAFESVLVNLLGHKVIENKEAVKSIYSYYNTGRSKASPGTKLTMKLAKYRENYHYRLGEKILVENVDTEDFAVEENKTLSALAFALPEICFAQWDSSASNIGSFLLMDSYDASYASRNSQREQPVNGKQMLIEKFNKRRPIGPSNEMRENQSYTIEVHVENQEGKQRVIFLKGTDYYLLSARILVYMIMKSENDAIKQYGVVSPYQFLGEHHTFFEDLNLRPYEK